jgi:probable rRNA maturation factor
VIVVDERGRPLPMRSLVTWLKRVAPARARGSVSIALVSESRIRALNRTYRRKDVSTDVLSFGADAEQSSGKGRTGGRGSRRRSGSPVQPRQLLQPIPPLQPISPDLFLGDIVIARGVARRQALASGHPVLAELKVLALHGLLHLLGYDHERDNGRMRRVEIRLRRKGGLREGLIERTAE